MEKGKTNCIKRTQKDYSMSFKLQVVSERERGEELITGAMRRYGIQSRSTIVDWLRKFGAFDWVNQTPSHLSKTSKHKVKR